MKYSDALLSIFIDNGVVQSPKLYKHACSKHSKLQQRRLKLNWHILVIEYI